MKKTKEVTLAASAAAFWLLCFSSLLVPLRLVQTFSFPPSTARRRRSKSSLCSASSSTSSSSSKNVNLPPENVKILILPGFGNDSNDYYLPQAPQGSLVRSLERRGWKKHTKKDEAATTDDEIEEINDRIRVLPVTRLDWLQVFLRGATDVKFWMANAAPTRPAFDWYLQRVATAVQQMTTASTTNDEVNDENSSDDTKVVLICHSAGGWLARASLGFYGTTSSTVREKEDDVKKNDIPETTTTVNAVDDSTTTTTTKIESSSPRIPLNRILGIVTLGAPHVPPPPNVMDMTRGALRITHETFPGAYHSKNQNGSSNDVNDDDDIFYITVAGNAVRGKKQERQSPFEPTTVQGFAYNSYNAVLGDGTVIGDGVVPVDAAHLDDAIQIDLDGIFHSINAPEQWYGSDAVIDSWHDTLLEEIAAARASQQHQQRQAKMPQEVAEGQAGTAPDRATS